MRIAPFALVLAFSLTAVSASGQSYSILGTWHCVANNREHDVTTQSFHADGTSYFFFDEFGSHAKMKSSYTYANGTLTTQIFDTPEHAEKIYKPGDKIMVDNRGSGVQDVQKIVWRSSSSMTEHGMGKDTTIQQCVRK